MAVLQILHNWNSSNFISGEPGEAHQETSSHEVIADQTINLGEVQFSITEINPDNVVLTFSRPLSWIFPDGSIDESTNQKIFTIAPGKSIKIALPTSELNHTWTISYLT